MLVRHFDFTPANARKLSERVNGDNYSDVFTKLTDLYSRLRTDYSIRDKAAYVFASLDRLFKEHEVQEPEEVK